LWICLFSSSKFKLLSTIIFFMSFSECNSLDHTAKEKLSMTEGWTWLPFENCADWGHAEWDQVQSLRGNGTVCGGAGFGHFYQT
jgi:hypothetical protein